MRRLFSPTITVLCAAVMFALSAEHARAAGSGEAYSDAMRPFVPAIERWAENLAAATDSSLLKPELACGPDLAELAEAAAWIAADLDGTAHLAPAHLSRAHDRLADSVSAMGAAAALACADPSAAAQQLAAEREGFDWALVQITYVTDPRYRGGN